MIHGLTTASLALLDRLSQTAQKHPKRITAAVAAVLLTGGGGAFAVASLGPDASDLPTKLVSYPVESLAENLSLEALEAPGFSLYRSEQTRSSDTAESLLQRMGVADPAAAAFLRADNTVRQNLLGRAGRLVSAETTDDHSLVRLTQPLLVRPGGVGIFLHQALRWLLVCLTESAAGSAPDYPW